MRKVIESAVFKFLQNGSRLENFTSERILTTEKLKKLSTYQLIAMFVSLIIMQLLLLLLGKWLWNSYLVPAVTSVKPIESVWQLLAISILLKLNCSDISLHTLFK